MATEQWRELLQRARDGDQEAFRELHQQYFPQVIARVRRKVWNPRGHLSGIANSVMASFFHGHLSDAELLEKDGIWTVLCRLAMKHADKHVKRLTRERDTVPLDGAPSVADGGIPPEAETEVMDLIEYVSQRLPEKGQKVMGLMLAGGYTTEQIADELGVVPETVLRWRERILERLDAASTRNGQKGDPDEVGA